MENHPVDELTQEYYKNSATNLTGLYDKAKNGITDLVESVFPDKSGKYLDIGAGSGRDLARLLEKGYDAIGVEPVVEMRDQAVGYYNNLKDRLFAGSLPELDSLKALKANEPDPKYSGILCSAVLQHIAREDLFNSVFTIKNLLKEKGRLLISLPASRPNRKSEERDEHDRLFIMYSPGEIELLLAQLGFQKIFIEPAEDGMNRPGVTWVNMAFQLVNSDESRPIDKVEAILNRDKKSATYKLALFRALCDIARENQKVVDFISINNENNLQAGVHVPLRIITEKWIEYYYHLLSYTKPIPQTNNSNKDMAFKSNLLEIIDYFSQSGGYSAYREVIESEDYQKTVNSNKVKSVIYKKIKSLYSKIGETIVKGPVTYAGMSTAGEPVFSYDPQSKSVVVSPDIWRDLTLMGHWIHDSLLLRWAELSEKMAKNAAGKNSNIEITKAEILSVLLEHFDPRRDVLASRKIFLGLDSPECVWSGKTLKNKFDVDHVIAYSLWHNNDLWNLLPVDSKVNNAKRDKLPEYNLLQKRKEHIVYYWRILNENKSGRFFTEARKFAGQKLPEKNWENPLFSALVEAVETTAMQRGVERWGV
ncbi:MAG: methyltransferase domain-containing protein [Leptospirales bacterium]